MCVHTHTHAHTAQMGYSVVSPKVEMRHLEGLKNPDGLNLGIDIFVCMYNVQMCMYMLGGRMSLVVSARTTFKWQSSKEGERLQDGAFKDWLSSRPLALKTIYWVNNIDSYTRFKMR